MHYISKSLYKTTAPAILILCVLMPKSLLSQTGSSVQKSFFIEDPKDRQKIEGAATIALVWGKTFQKPYQGYKSALINLNNAMNSWTEIKSTPYNQLLLTSDRLHSIPFAVIVSEEEFALTYPERENVNKYLESGGFIFCENLRGTYTSSPVETSFYRLMEETLGDGVTSKPILNNHPVFSSFYDFADGPPVVRSDRGIINYGPLTGFWYKDRLVAIYSNMTYTTKWNERTGNILQLKMGINLIIFALTQDGGLARRQ